MSTVTALPETMPTTQTPGHAAAFFDLDGTLIKGSANIPLAKAAFRAGFVSKTELLHDLKNGVSFLLKGATDERSVEVRDRILQAVKGRKATELEAMGEGFIDQLVDAVQPASAALLAEHKAQGDARVIISASPTEIVSRLARELDLEFGIGTTAARQDGVYTGKLDGPFCYEQGKAVIIAAMAQENGWDLRDCSAYSDSISDLPMLEIVGHPGVINPDRELKMLAAQRGWPIVEISEWRAIRRRDMPLQAVRTVLGKLPL